MSNDATSGMPTTFIPLLDLFPKCRVTYITPMQALLRYAAAGVITIGFVPAAAPAPPGKTFEQWKEERRGQPVDDWDAKPKPKRIRKPAQDKPDAAYERTRTPDVELNGLKAYRRSWRKGADIAERRGRGGVEIPSEVYAKPSEDAFENYMRRGRE